MKLTKIDPIGIRVRNIESSLKLYQDRFGLPPRGIEINAEYGVRIAFLPLGEILIEVVEPIPGTLFEKILQGKKGKALKSLFSIRCSRQCFRHAAQSRFSNQRGRNYQADLIGIQTPLIAKGRRIFCSPALFNFSPHQILSRLRNRF